MLDGFRDLFLEALYFDGEDAMPLVERWNNEVNRVARIVKSLKKEAYYHAEAELKEEHDD